MIQARVNTTMSYELKTAFMSLQSKHGKDMKDAIERGALEIIADVDPEKALELEIVFHEEQALLKKQQLAEYRASKQLNNVTSQDDCLENIRLEKFESRKTALATQVKGGKADWKTIAEVFMFDSPAKAREWTLRNLKEECLLG